MARDLHDRLQRRGVESTLAYGYGRRGKADPKEKGIRGAIRISSFGTVAANVTAHRILGLDPVAPHGAAREHLIRAIADADVIHLHVLHSHYVSFTWLLPKLRDTGKPIVWTAHDSWLLTGRCAITEGCERWRNGCGACPTLKNYPPCFVDLSGPVRRRKHPLINALGTRLTIACPSQFLAAQHREAYPEREVVVVPNGLDASFERSVTPSDPRASSPIRERGRTLLMVAADLRYPKTDAPFIQSIRSQIAVRIETVGAHSWLAGPGVVNHGPVHDRVRLTQLYRSADWLLFTSSVDSYGLVMAESLAAGTPVLASPSDAAREILGAVGSRPASDALEAVAWLTGKEPPPYPARNRSDLAALARAAFSGDAMCERYLSLYAARTESVS